MEPGRFCWLDLAATDEARATAFYTALAGWSAYGERLHGGVFTRLFHGAGAIGSVYQLSAAARAAGAPSHWTPYIEVASLEAALARTETLGGSVIVDEMLVPGVARLALIRDPVDALTGLWEPLTAAR